MDQSNFTVAPLQISENLSCMVMISEGVIHFFDNNGKNIEREHLGLPEVFVLNFNDDTNRSFTIVREKEIVSAGSLYVINRDNEVVFTSTDREFNVFSRITDNTIVLGIQEIPRATDIMLPAPTGSRLIENNHLTNCIYKDIEELDYYLLMNRADGKIDVLYFDKDEVKLFEDFSSVSPASLLFNFSKKEYINKEAIIVSRNDKYGLICHGQLIADCIYDEIKLINANPNYYCLASQSLTKNPLWFVFRIGRKVGIYGTNGLKTEIIYDDVNVIDWKTFHPNRDYKDIRYFVLELDGKMYTTEEMAPICDNEDLTFRGFMTPTVLAFSGCDGIGLELYDYKARKKDFVVVDSCGDVLFECLDSTDFLRSDMKYAMIRYIGFPYTIEEFAFSFEQNEVVENPFYQSIDDDEEIDDDEKYDNDYSYMDQPDDTDYERDTYYALGGENYDEWRKNGGNLDDMMDGMGL